MDFSILFENDIKILLAEIYLTIVIFCLLVYGVAFQTARSYDYPILTRHMGWLMLYGFGMTLLILSQSPFLFDFVAADNLFYNWVVLNGSLKIDSFVTTIHMVILLSASASILISLDYFRSDKLNFFEVIVLIGLVALSLMLLVAANDLIALYLALELQSLSLYVLASLKRNSEFSTESGIKYFILGAVASGFFLFGASLIYGFTGLYKFEDLALFFSGSASLYETYSAVLLGLIFVTVAFLFKIAAAPFHMWTPDVYEGAPTAITGFFAITPKIAVLGLLMRLFLEPFFEFIGSWQNLLALCAVLSLAVGAFGALYQKKVKRLLAYSSIGHCGFMLLGLSTGTIEGLYSVVFYILVYIITVISTFSIVLATRKQSKALWLAGQKSNDRLRYITDLAGLSKTNPVLSFTLALVLFSMAGVPPLAGFFAKLQVFFAAIGSSMYLVSIIGVLLSTVSAFYYIRMIKIMYFDNVRTWHWFTAMDRENATMVALTTTFLVFFFVYPTPLIVLSHKVVFALCL